jgi:hypothetical protein
MKVALCLFGQPRFIDNEFGQESHKHHIYKQSEVDVFAHYWFDKESTVFNSSDWSTHHNNYVHPKSDELIQKFYTPKVYLEEKPKEKFDYEELKETCSKLSFFSENNFYNLRSHLYSFEKSLSLLESHVSKTGETYDYIVSSRYDNKIEFFPDLNKLTKERVYIDSRCNYNFTDAILLFDFNFLSYFKPYTNFKKLTSIVPAFTSEEYKKYSFLLNRSRDSFSHIDDLHARLLRARDDFVGQW